MQRAPARPMASAAIARTGMCSTAPITQRRSPLAAAAAWRRSCRCCLAAASHPSSCESVRCCTCPPSLHLQLHNKEAFDAAVPSHLHQASAGPRAYVHVLFILMVASLMEAMVWKFAAPTEGHLLERTRCRCTHKVYDAERCVIVAYFAAGCVPAAGGRVRRQVLLHRGASGHPSHSGQSHPVYFSLQV